MRKKTKSKPKPIAQYKYRYTDENGNLAYLKIRNEYADKSKDFSFEQPNGERNLQGVHRVIYNLPGVLSSPRIYLVEGEKDANILIKYGLTATTLDTGANSAWQEYYNDYFKDKEVIILPDNDEAGFLYAKNILGHLPNAKVLNLPDLNEKEDVYDWIMAGHSIKELGELPSMSKSEFLSGQSVGKAKDTVNKGNGKGKETATETAIRLVVEESDAKGNTD